MTKVLLEIISVKAVSQAIVDKISTMEETLLQTKSIVYETD